MVFPGHVKPVFFLYNLIYKVKLSKLVFILHSFIFIPKTLEIRRKTFVHSYFCTNLKVKQSSIEVLHLLFNPEDPKVVLPVAKHDHCTIWSASSSTEVGIPNNYRYSCREYWALALHCSSVSTNWSNNLDCYSL